MAADFATGGVDGGSGAATPSTVAVLPNGTPPPAAVDALGVAAPPAATEASVSVLPACPPPTSLPPGIVMSRAADVVPWAIDREEECSAVAVAMTVVGAPVGLPVVAAAAAEAPSTAPGVGVADVTEGGVAPAETTPDVPTIACCAWS